MGEDVADKTRRNLMFVSTGIIAVWMLGIPLDGKLIGAVDLKSVEPWRAWACALAVLVYTALRFYFAPAYAEQRKEWSEERSATFEQVQHSHVAWALAGQRSSGRVRGVYFEIPQCKHGSEWRACIPSSDLDFNVDDGTGSIRIAWRTPEEGLRNSYIDDGKTYASFAISKRRLMLLHLEAMRYNYVPSWAVLEHSLPYWLFILASAICAHRLLVHIGA